MCYKLSLNNNHKIIPSDRKYLICSDNSQIGIKIQQYKNNLKLTKHQTITIIQHQLLLMHTWKTFLIVGHN
jgi:hypothetical protein